MPWHTQCQRVIQKKSFLSDFQAKVNKAPARVGLYFSLGYIHSTLFVIKVVGFSP